MPTIMKDRKNSSRDGFMIDSAQKFRPVNPYQMNPPDKRLGTAPAPMNQFGRPRTAAMLLETAAGINRPNTGTQGLKAFQGKNSMTQFGMQAARAASAGI